MRRICIAGNWKMNTTISEGEQLASALVERMKSQSATVDVVLCPPFPHLQSVGKALEGSALALGAQTMHFEEKGAYTGEVSPVMLEGLCRFVIIGHSERRQYFAETDATVNQKVKAALAHSLTPIVCVGESLDIRHAGSFLSHIESQVKAAFDGVTLGNGSEVLVAYEPIWAIGTGLAASKEQAQEVIGSIRSTLKSIYGDAIADFIRILYGGSTNAENIDSFLAEGDIDGALVGGASLKVDSFAGMVEKAAGAGR
ncbi:triose-phosphate isomerase [Candidatus Wirthbacteria bacterium CG2_30_54_11]|uniref:Triosephosphate isomerase n=1 Tax=Candidatus Wirthbacteria bacterium CG2_30_54_11 TaxID=1817892 RepID=A0A1J5IN11_9BACT|nr:MAG: triose-phosphate isomerase [Candidatus Wirthbacteria bacterium CG2_30_54_11]